MSSSPLLHIENLSKTFPGQRALDETELTLMTGEVQALVGHNGSGKSTLVKILAGYHQPDPGARIKIAGAHETFSASAAWRDRVHVIHQDLGLIPTLDTVDNIAVGRGFHTGHTGRIHWSRERAEVASRAHEFGLDFDVRAPISRLSVAERSIVALLRALRGWAAEPQLLVLDEVTAALPEPEAERVHRVIEQVAAQGHAVVFVTHRLEEVLALADRITVLREGKVVASLPRPELDHDRLVQLIVGRPLHNMYSETAGAGGEVALRVRDLSGPGLESFDVEIRRGEIVGVAGILGSGRDHVAGLLYGRVRPEGGSITVRGSEVPHGSPHQSLQRGIAYVPTDRAHDGCIPAWSVRTNLTLSHLRPLWRRGRLSPALERRESETWMNRVQLLPPDYERPLASFSGGNQQKVVLAKCLRTEPAVLLLDEPTQGVDIGAKASIFALLAEAAKDGMAILMCSSEAEDMASMCDRVLVMRHGRVVRELSGGDLNPDNIVACSLEGRPRGDSDAHHPQLEGA